MTHGRLPWYDPSSLDSAQREVYEEITGGPRASGRAFRLTDDAGRLEGPFNAMLTAPAAGMALQRLGAAIRYATTLPARWREIAILEAAAARCCDFEWYAHERVARAAGLTDTELTAIRDGADAPTLTPEEHTVRALCRTLLSGADLDDPTYAHAEQTLGRTALYELVVLLGYYDTLALSLRVFHTPLPAGEPPIFD